MPRAKAILQNQYPYNVSARCINREWFTLDMPLVWEIFCEELYWVTKTHRFEISAFVLMSNHYHMIVQTPESNISSGMQQFMKRTSVRLTQAGNRVNETFAGRHHKTILDSQTYFLNAYKYNYLNPIKVGICKAVEEYPYSTLRGLLGFEKLLIPVVSDDELIDNTIEHLEWLNFKPSQEKLEAVKLALKKPRFRSPKKRNSGQPVLGQDELI